MKAIQDIYQEIVMEGHPDDGTCGRGAFDKWVSEEPLNYCSRFLVRPSDRISLAPKDRTPYVLEEYGELTVSAGLVGAVALSSGISRVPPHHPPMRFRRQNCEEALYVLSGSGDVEVEEEKYSFFADDAIFLPAWAKHRIANTGSEDLVVMFVRGIAMSPFEGLGEIEIDGAFKSLDATRGKPAESPLSRSPVRYWKKIVVTEGERFLHYSLDGKVATSPGQQGFNYISPANVGALTVRRVGGKGPAARLSDVSDRFKEFPLSWHNTEEIHYYIEGEGMCVVDDQRIPFQKGDTIFTPARSMHKNYPKDDSYREMCATGIRFRPFEGLTETAIDQREYRLRENN